MPRSRVLGISKAIHANPRVALRYGSEALPYAHRYYAVNFCQAYLAGLRVAADLPPRPAVLDLGGGGGASACGFLSALHDSGLRPRLAVVDRSAAQLRLLRAVALPYLRGLYGPTFRPRLERADLLQSLRRRRDRFDAVVAAYSLGELPDSAVLEAVRLVRRRLKPSGRFVVIETKETDVLHLVQEAWGRAPASRLDKGPVRIPACRKISGGRTPVASRSVLRPRHAVFQA